MRILLVEDNIDFAASIEKALRLIDGCEVVWKRSKAKALAVLQKELFDIVILDRRIPTDDDVLDDNVDHGWAVFLSIVEHQPGTSVWFLTGNVDADFPSEVHDAYGRRGDIHCCGREDPVYRVIWKDKMSNCVSDARVFNEEVQKTDSIFLEQAGQPVNLCPEEERILRLFGRKKNGTRVEVRSLAGGLSGARVLRVSVFNAAGALMITSVAKVGLRDGIVVEQEKYHSEIVKLAPGSFPQVTAEIDLGAGRYSAVFYGVVGSEVRCLFDELVANPDESAEVVQQLRNDQGTWHGARQTARVSVATVRRSLIGDVDFGKISDLTEGLDLEDVETIEIGVHQCVQHGDLHCANVLFDDRGRAMLIDYPDTKRTIASLDPVALELSTVFHKDAPNNEGWPTEGNAAGWTEIDEFCVGAPFEAYLRACRNWARDIAASEEEVWAVGYGYALRQMKYQDTDKVLAKAIAAACVEKLLGR